jgi:hypothetical protein
MCDVLMCEVDHSHRHCMYPMFDGRGHMEIRLDAIEPSAATVGVAILNVNGNLVPRLLISLKYIRSWNGNVNEVPSRDVVFVPSPQPFAEVCRFGDLLFDSKVLSTPT